MGAYLYCDGCGEGLPAPTRREVLQGYCACRHCGHLNDPRMSVTEVVESLLDDIESLERRITDLERKV